MKKVLEGVAHFEREVFPEHRERFRQLARGQSPDTLLISCSDSRVVPDLIVQARPGELFVCRNAGNIVPSHGRPSGGVSATIEYAVVALGVRDIIICGHSDCGAMKALLNPQIVAAMPSVARWLRYAERAASVVRENFADVADPRAVDALVEENVLAQLDNLKTHPCVASRFGSGSLSLHGWVFDIESGRIRTFDAERKAFVSLTAAEYAAAPPAGEKLPG
ncbi:MAG TPA: carbonic anhydrase [Bryobacteraceae bacterium]|nr:carbonic anhydrase [Bryobacteraceae bacterium]